MDSLNRREMLQLTAALAIAGTLPLEAKASAATPTDRPQPLASANDAHLLWARLHGDLSGRTAFYFTHGTVWGFKPQADDLTVEDFAKRVYGYSGVAARKMLRQPDGSIHMRQKAWSFYRHPVTDEITDKIPNPYTGVDDTAAPMSGKTSERALSAPGPNPYDMRVRRLGAHAWITTSSIARFQTPGISWFKLEGQLQDYACATADLDNPAATHIPNSMSQNIVAEWQTWTKMHGMPGHILFKGNGAPLFSLAEVPDDTIAAIERFFPGALAEVRAWAR